VVQVWKESLGVALAEMSKSKREDFEEQLRALQQDIGVLSQKLAIPSKIRLVCYRSYVVYMYLSAQRRIS
jgi:hypothetical protein